MSYLKIRHSTKYFVVIFHVFPFSFCGHHGQHFCPFHLTGLFTFCALLQITANLKRCSLLTGLTGAWSEIISWPSQQFVSRQSYTSIACESRLFRSAPSGFSKDVHETDTESFHQIQWERPSNKAVSRQPLGTFGQSVRLNCRGRYGKWRWSLIDRKSKGIKYDTRYEYIVLKEREKEIII